MSEVSVGRPHPARRRIEARLVAARGRSAIGRSTVVLSLADGPGRCPGPIRPHHGSRCPRKWASALSSATPPFTSIRTRTLRPGEACERSTIVRINEVSTGEAAPDGPLLALAADNISRDPAVSSRRRGPRGTPVRRVRIGRPGPRISSAAAWRSTVRAVPSVGYLLCSLPAYPLRSAGAAASRVPRSNCLCAGDDLLVLTNMRYTMTVQPLMFAFMAMAAVAAFRLEADAQEGRLPR